MKSESLSRVYSLDYLRGIMALSILIYHYTIWTLDPEQLRADTLLGKLGIYGVSIFYILSGLSLAMVYKNKILSLVNVKNFLVKRAFRLIPVFWVCVTAALFMKFTFSIISGEVFDISLGRVLLNYSLLFSYVEPTAYLTPGAWSIGNEVVFYSIFPLVFLIANKYKCHGVYIFILAISIAIGIYYAYFIFDQQISLDKQWAFYVQPFNQFFLFWFGVVIGLYAKKKAIKKWVPLSTLATAVVGFIFYQVDQDSITLVSGINRVIFSAFSIAAVWSIYILNPTIKGVLAKTLAFLGEGCYSIYLLHPIIGMPLAHIGALIDIPKAVSFCTAFFITLLVSYFCFHYLEKPMIHFAKKRF